MRQSAVLKEWTFHLGNIDGFELPDFNDSAWTQVQIPHDWAINGPFNPENDKQVTRILQDGETHETAHYGRTGGLPHVGIGLYRTSFDLAESGRSIRLEFDGVMSHGKVYVNGKFAGERPYGYSSFAFDIGDLTQAGKNIVAVRVENPPTSSRWYPGAGIYREVRLLKLEEAHFKYNGIELKTVSLDLEQRSATLQVNAECSAGDVEFEVLDPSGMLLASGKNTLKLTQCRFWSPEEPSLYLVRVKLFHRGILADQLEIPYGFRQIAFDSERGMTLNSKPYYMKGVCLHHDAGPLGAAFSLPSLKHRFRLLKQIGCNAVRSTHNPPDPKWLDLCDSMGFLAIDEAFDCWQIAKCANDYSTLYAEWHERDLCDMIRRDRNHPSVIMWSIGNEINEQRDKDGASVARHLAELVRNIDKSRPVTAGLDVPDMALENRLPQELDIVGWNYKPHRYEEFHKRLPDKPQYGSETASTVSSRGEYFLPAESGVKDHENCQCSSYDLEHCPWSQTPDTEFHYQDQCPWIMGEFVWTGFDYLGEPSPYNHHWPSHSSYFGIFDLCALPKDRAWLYAARWTSRKILHILPHWNWEGREGTVVPVHVYTNYGQIELLVNGKSYGVKKLSPSNRIVWDNVIYEPGSIVAVAKDDAGNLLESVSRKTAAQASKISLSADRNILTADGEDLAFVTVSVLDVSGEIQPHSSHDIRFTVSGGTLAALGNGDPRSIETFDQKHISQFHGQSMLIIRSRKTAGTIKVRAEADGLSPAELELSATDRPYLDSIKFPL